MVNAVDLLRKSFGSLKTPVGQKLVGVFFLIQLLNFGSSYITELSTSTTMMGASVVLGLAATLLGIAATIGGLRSFRDGEFDRENFTENLLWPFGRILGANLTAGIFAYAVAFLFIGPAIVLATTSGITSVSGLTGAGAGVLALGAIGAILGIAAFIYVSVTLMLAQPFIAIEDRRMFQALDKSIQSTKGSRLSIFTALMGILAVYIVLIVIAGAVSVVAPEQVAAALSSVVFGSVMTPVGLKLLEELSRELSEE